MIIAVVIVCIVLVLWLTIGYIVSYKTCSDLRGMWVAYEDFAKMSEVDGLFIIIGETTHVGTPITVIIMNKNGENTHSTFMHISGSVAKFEQPDGGFIFGKKCTIEYDLKQNYMKIYDHDTIYAFCYKDPELTALLK